MTTLTGAVGRRGVNQPHDVATIQAAFTQIPADPRRVGRKLWEGPIDGRGGPALEQAIATFQATAQAAARLPQTGKIEAVGPGVQALDRALPAAYRSLRGLKQTTTVFCSDCAPHRVPERLRAIANKSLLPLAMAEGLAKLTGDFYRQSGLLLRPDATAIEGDGRFTADLGLDGVRWLDRYGRFASGRMAVPSVVPTLLGQAVMRYPALAAGVAGKLQVRSAQRFASLAGPARTVDGERLQRLGIRRTNDPTADRILDVIAGEIEAGNPGGSEVDSLLGVLAGVHVTQTEQVQSARTKVMPRPGEPVDDFDAALRALNFVQKTGDYGSLLFAFDATVKVRKKDWNLKHL